MKLLLYYQIKPKKIIYNADSEIFRTTIKNRHGRLIYLELKQAYGNFVVQKCFYIDRMNGGQFTTIPKKFVASKFLTSSLLAVVASQLDRHFYGIEYSDDYYKCSTEAFIEQTASNFSKGYKFLVLSEMVI